MVNKLTIYKALEPFLTRPDETLHLSDISRIIQKPHPTVRQWLNALEVEGVLIKEHKGRLTLYRLNLRNQNIIDHLTIVEKNKLICECNENPILSELVNHIHHNIKENQMALIFGSASVSFKDAHDIDLLLIKNVDSKPLEKFAEKVNKKLHIIQLKKLNSISGSLRMEIIKKHLIISGSESILRWILWQT